MTYLIALIKKLHAYFILSGFSKGHTQTQGKGGRQLPQQSGSGSMKNNSVQSKVSVRLYAPKIALL